MSGQNKHNAIDFELRAEDLLDEGRYEDAIIEAREAIALNANSVAAHLVCGSAFKELGRLDETAKSLETVLTLMPGLSYIRVNLANTYAELELFSKAEKELQAAIERDPRLVEAYASLGSIYLRTGRFDLAVAPTRFALSLDPGNVVANQNIAALLAREGNPAAKEYRDRAFALEQVVVEPPQSPGLPVALVLIGAASGNVPYQYILPRHKYGRVLWYLEYARGDGQATLPPYDFVFNAVGDPDAAPEAQQATVRFVATNQHPLINQPDAVGHTFRSDMPSLLGAVANLVVPKAQRFENTDVSASIANSGLSYPLIVRPAGRHGGEGIRRFATRAELEATPLGYNVAYATEFHDYRSHDGWYRKYRAIFVDRQPFAYHLAIGQRWLLHYATADMDNDVIRRTEEEAYLCDPQRALGPKAWDVLCAVAATLDLDFGGIDFSLLPDGGVLFFEANATMLVHPEGNKTFAYKNVAVDAIADAVDGMIRKKMCQVGNFQFATSDTVARQSPPIVATPYL